MVITHLPWESKLTLSIRVVWKSGSGFPSGPDISGDSPGFLGLITNLSRETSNGTSPSSSGYSCHEIHVSILWFRHEIMKFVTGPLKSNPLRATFPTKSKGGGVFSSWGSISVTPNSPRQPTRLGCFLSSLLGWTHGSDRFTIVRNRWVISPI